MGRTPIDESVKADKLKENQESDSPKNESPIDESVKAEAWVKIIANGCKNMAKGTEHIVSGKMAFILVSKGVAKLKK